MRWLDERPSNYTVLYSSRYLPNRYLCDYNSNSMYEAAIREKKQFYGTS